MQKTGTATWDLTSLRRPREGVSPPSLQQQDRTFSFRNHVMLSAVLRIQIRVFLCLLDPDLLVRGKDLDPLSSSKNSKKNPDSYCFVTSF
jgi:hypothetical protein